MDSVFRLDGRAAVVTGGASGIGLEVCRVLTQAGAAVTIADIDGARAAEVSRELPGSRVCSVDVTDEADVQTKIGALDRIDILVNNAGIGLVGGIEETSAEDFRRLMRVNVEGVYLVTRAAMPRLLAAHGTVVNIGSVSGLVAVKRRFAYCATKGAVIALSRQLAIDYAGRLRVNCVCPGTVETPFVEAYLEKNHKHEKEKVRAELHARQPIGRMGRPREVANMVRYLCSEEAEFVTGSVVTIDGGWTAM